MFHARDGAIFSKNSTFVFFDGASPITENGIQLRSPSPIMAPGNKHDKWLSAPGPARIIMVPKRFLLYSVISVVTAAA